MSEKEFHITDFITHSYSTRPEKTEGEHVTVVNGSLLGANVYSKNKSFNKQGESSNGEN